MARHPSIRSRGCVAYKPCLHTARLAEGGDSVLAIRKFPNIFGNSKRPLDPPKPEVQVQNRDYVGPDACVDDQFIVSIQESHARRTRPCGRHQFETAQMRAQNVGVSGKYRSFGRSLWRSAGDVNGRTVPCFSSNNGVASSSNSDGFSLLASQSAYTHHRKTIEFPELPKDACAERRSYCRRTWLRESLVQPFRAAEC